MCYDKKDSTMKRQPAFKFSFKSSFGSQQGFTLVEISLAIGIVLLLLIIASYNLSGLIPKTSTRSTFKTLVTEIKSQQLKAISGNANGSLEPQSQGIYFNEQSYILFTGDFYSAASPNNIEVDLENKAIFTDIDLPGDSIVFSAGSGLVKNYEASHSAFTVTTSNQVDEITVELNRYGILSWD